MAEPANLSFGDIDEELEKLSKKSFTGKSRAELLEDDEEGHDKELAAAASFGNIGAA